MSTYIPLVVGGDAHHLPGFQLHALSIVLLHLGVAWHRQQSGKPPCPPPIGEPELETLLLLLALTQGPGPVATVGGPRISVTSVQCQS